MMEIASIKSRILSLLEESPISSDEVKNDVKESVAAGETALAFDTLCSWIYEDEAAISRAYYDRLVAMAVDLEAERSVDRLDELIRND